MSYGVFYPRDLLTGHTLAVPIGKSETIRVDVNERVDVGEAGGGCA